VTARLSRPSLRDQALAVLRQAMVAGEIRPGEIHSAAALAQQLGVSSGPVREAMLTLVNQGLLEMVPNRGFRVPPVSDADLDEIYELRLMLEVPAVESLARSTLETGEPPADPLGLVRGHADRCEEAAEAGDVTAFLTADRDFHLGLLAWHGNKRLLAVVENLRDQTRLYGLQRLADDHRLLESAREHFRLLEEVVSGRPEEARDRMVTHLAHTRGDWSSPPSAAVPPRRAGRRTG